MHQIDTAKNTGENTATGLGQRSGYPEKRTGRSQSDVSGKIVTVPGQDVKLLVSETDPTQNEPVSDVTDKAKVRYLLDSL